MKKILVTIIFFMLIISFSVYTNAADVEIESQSEEQIEVETSENAESPVIEENGAETNIPESKVEYFEVKAKVLEVKEPRTIENGNMKDIVQEVKIEILEGEYDTREFTVNYIMSYDLEGKILAYELKKDDKVWVQIAKNIDGNVNVEIENVVRQNYIYFMAIIFLMSILLVGGKRGIKAIIGLAITVLAVYLIMVKGILAGYNPIGMSILTSLIIIITTFIIIGGGINKKIITASIGTFGGVVTAGIVASIFSYLLKLSGAGEDSILLSVNSKNIIFNFRDLIFAGIVISSLGACMDVGMSIASSLDELRLKTKDMEWKELFKSGMNIGRDIIGTMANTLILAYVGSSLTLILLFLTCNFSFVQILNKETIATDIISAISGSMGVVYTVPITAFIYGFLNRNKTIYKTVSDNKLEGKRSLKL